MKEHFLRCEVVDVIIFSNAETPPSTTALNSFFRVSQLKRRWFLLRFTLTTLYFRFNLFGFAFLRNIHPRKRAFGTAALWLVLASHLV